MNEQYIENLLRFIGASTYSHLMLQASHDLFGKSWFQISQDEKQAVINAVSSQVVGNTSGLTDALLRSWLNQAVPSNPVGFQPGQGVPASQKVDETKSQSSGSGNK